MAQAHLSEQEYQQVLSILQSYNYDTFDEALAHFKAGNFDQNHDLNRENDREQLINLPEQDQLQIVQNDDQAIINKYFDFLKKKHANHVNIIGLFFTGIRSIFSKLLQLIAKILLPQALFNKYLKSQFYRIYYNRIKLPNFENKLSDLLNLTKNIGEKSVIVAISSKQGCDNFIRLFNSQQIVKLIQRQYYFAGYMINDTDLSVLDEVRSPQIIICRMNIFEEIEIIQRFQQHQLQRIDAKMLQTCFLKGKNLMRKDKNVVIKFNNHLRQRLGIYQMEEQQEQIDIRQRDQINDEVFHQNEMYKIIEEAENIKKMQEQHRQQELKEWQQLNKIRRLSIPQQPQEGDIVKISFRCPNGSTVCRNFLRNEKIELIFIWVELSEDIQFEQSRSFELMHSYPPQPLSSSKQKLIGQIMQQSQEKIVIREQ